MTTPSGGSRPIGPDPTAALPTAPRDVPPPSSRDSRPPGGARPAAGAAGAVPLTPRERDGRDGPRRRRGAPLAWLPWALLAALLGLLALTLLAGTLAGAERATRSAGSAGSAAGGSGAPAAAGRLQVGETDLLSSREALGRLASLQGQRAVGRGLRVESVVADEGFWVGSGRAERVFVYLTPQARESQGESGFQVRAGQTVDVNGTVTGTSAGDPERFGVTDAEGARQLTTQRAYVRASQVRLSSS